MLWKALRTGGYVSRHSNGSVLLMDGQRLVSVQPCNHFTLISAPTIGKAHDRANGCLQVGSWEKMTRVDMMEIS